MEVKLFRQTTGLEIAKLEPAMNAWLKTLPPNAAIVHTGTAYCSIDGVPSILISVFWESR